MPDVLSDAAVTLLRKTLIGALDAQPGDPDWAAMCELYVAFELAAPGGNPFGCSLQIIPVPHTTKGTTNADPIAHRHHEADA